MVLHGRADDAQRRGENPGLASFSTFARLAVLDRISLSVFAGPTAVLRWCAVTLLPPAQIGPSSSAHRDLHSRVLHVLQPPAFS